MKNNLKLVQQQAQPEIALPCTPDAERGLLGALMLESSLWIQVEGLTGSDFFIPSNEKIFRAMRKLRQENIPFNPVLLMDRLRAEGEYEAVGGHAYVSSLVDGIPLFSKESDISGYAFQIKERSIERQLLKLSDSVTARVMDGESDVIDVMADLEKRLHDLRAARTQKRLPNLGDDTDRWVDESLASNEDRSAVNFGAGLLDSKLTGPFPGDVIIVGARTSVGKTVLALQAATSTAGVGYLDHDPVVAFFSLEMSREKLRSRALQIEVGMPVNPNSLKRMSPAEVEAVRKAGRRLSYLKIFTDEQKRLTAPAIFAQCQRLKRDYGHLDLVVIDYLGLLEATTKRHNQVAEIEDITRNLKITAMELGTPFIVPAQLNRESENGSNSDRPQLKHLRSSGSIEQDADTVILLHRPKSVDRSLDVENIEIGLEKQRDGWVGWMAGQFDKRTLQIHSIEEIRC